MGMYTGLRCKIIVKEKYRKELAELLLTSYNRWEDFNSDIFKKFSLISRSDFIPYGDLCYMPDCWESEYNLCNNKAVFKDNKFDIDTGFWEFQCSLKNYDDTIEYFLENILTEICEISYHIETLYEEDDNSYLYKILDNKVIELKKRINYSFCDNEKYWDITPAGYDVIHYSKYDFTYNGYC